MNGGLSRRPGGARRKWSLRSAVWRPSETDQPLLTVSTPPWYPGGDGTRRWGLVVSLLTHVSCIERTACLVKFYLKGFGRVDHSYENTKLTKIDHMSEYTFQMTPWENIISFYY